MREDQLMAQSLSDWAIKNIRPSTSLKKIWQKHMGQGATNLEHMAAGLNLAFYLGKPGEGAAVDHLINNTYRHNFEVAFRSVFEGLSVSYSGYNSETPTGILLRCDIPVLRMLARKWLRWDYTTQILCSSIHGRIIIACGRTRDASQKGVYNDATDFRSRCIQGIDDDWWPPKGVGKGYWKSTHSVSARAWRESPSLPPLVFTLEERAALRGWVVRREVTPMLRSLIDPIRLWQGLHVARVDGGHISWMNNIQSYAQSDNTAQPLIWAQGDNIKRVHVVDPVCGAEYHDDTGWLVNGVPVAGFPAPQKPHIFINNHGPEYDI